MKADITGLKTDLKTLKVDIQHDMAEMKRELLDHTEAVETRLLTEFWKWAKTADARYRQNQGVVGAMDDHVERLRIVSRNSNAAEPAKSAAQFDLAA